MSADKPSLTTSERIVIKISNNVDAEKVIGDLECIGFKIDIDLKVIGVLLGYYNGDLENLEKIKGVAIVVHDVKMGAIAAGNVVAGNRISD